MARFDDLLINGARLLLDSLKIFPGLCHRVGIVSAGAMADIGDVAALRARGPRQIEIEAPQAPAGWAAGLDGVRVLGEPDSAEAGGVIVVELADDADDQAVLAAALATGPVRRFAARRPSLTELFREVVSA